MDTDLDEVPQRKRVRTNLVVQGATSAGSHVAEGDQVPASTSPEMQAPMLAQASAQMTALNTCMLQTPAQTPPATHVHMPDQIQANVAQLPYHAHMQMLLHFQQLVSMAQGQQASNHGVGLSSPGSIASSSATSLQPNEHNASANDQHAQGSV